MRKILFTIILLSAAGFSQSLRSLNNNGVDLYKNKKFTDAEVNFRKGIEKEPDRFETNFNLGDAYYKQQKYDDAIKSYNKALKLTDSKTNKAQVLHNIGNSLLKSQKIQESIDAYKNSLKLNPDDQDTKYNLSYALSLLNQQKNQQQNKNDKSKDQQNKDQQNQDQQNKNNQDKNQQNKNQQQDQQNQNKPPQDQKAQQDQLKQQDKNKMSKEEAEQILNALKNNEKDLQKKLRKKTGIRVNTDKDW